MKDHLFPVLRYYGRVARIFATQPAFRSVLYAAIVVWSVGAVFYRLVEGWSWLDCFYFCLITLATIGYGDLTPTTDAGKLFTIVYVILGLGILATFLTAVARAPVIMGQARRSDGEQVEPESAGASRQARGRGILDVVAAGDAGRRYSSPMAKTECFDISTGVDLQEVDNALNQARKEISNRFDFKGVLAEVEFDRRQHKLTLHTADDFKLQALWQVIEQRMRARGVPLKNLKRGDVQKAGGSTVRQEVLLAQAIDPDTTRGIVRRIKDGGYKRVQAQVQGDEVRVTAPSRDELQAVIRDLRAEDWGVELKFGNYR